MAPRTTSLAKCRIRQSDIDRVTNEIVAAQGNKDKLSGYRKRILEHHRKAATSAVEMWEHRVLCGRNLAAAKADIGHGAFLRWIDEDFTGVTGFGRRTAQRYLALHRDYENYIAGIAEQGSDQELIRSFCESKLESIRIKKSSRRDEADKDTPDQTTADQVTGEEEDDDPNGWLTTEQILTAVKGVIGDIECDPCATSSPFGAAIADIEYSVVQNGLAQWHAWPGAVWVAPGHVGDLSAWAWRTLEEFDQGNLREAIVCLPMDTPFIPPAFFDFPIAISREPLTVGYPHRDGVIKPRQLRSQSLFFYISHKPDLRRFADQFRDIAVAFTPLSSARAWAANLSAAPIPLAETAAHAKFRDALASIRTVMAPP